MQEGSNGSYHLDSRVARLEAQHEALTGWMKRLESKIDGLDDKLEEHRVHHRNGNGKNGNGYQNGEAFVLILPKRLLTRVSVIAGGVAGVVIGVLQGLQRIGIM